DYTWEAASRISTLRPYGQPRWRLRFTPISAGLHQLKVAGVVEGRHVELAPIQIHVTESPQWPGVLEPHPNHSLLRYRRNGREFWAAAMNMRSPYDTRYDRVFPGTAWKPWNLKLYADLFQKYEQAGIKVIEVWLASWWLAPEWIPDARQNHGIGWYNQERLWFLDRLFELARQHGIYIILAIHNHGKFSLHCDKEWDRNPFYRGNGGYLTNPEEFFYSKRAWTDYERFVRYMCARYGWADNLLAWKLFTEINLTGRNGSWYKSAWVQKWHQKAALAFKKYDPLRHMVTTHWSGSYETAQRSMGLATLPELEMLTLDAYYNGNYGVERFYRLLTQTFNFQNQVNKPCIITEFGGSPWADILPHLYQGLHLALWTSFFGKLPTTPGLWWFPMVEEHNLYQEYQAINRFASGESRASLTRWHNRNPSAAFTMELVPDPSPPQKTSPKKHNFELWALYSQSRILGWIFDRSYYLGNDRFYEKPPRLQHFTLFLGDSSHGENNGTNLVPGKYRIDFWNCRTGEVINTHRFTVTGQNAQLSWELPPFTGDIAFKIVPDN
ncbi:MAG: hypothetical protein D6820_02295, partial [Lentisphaerae bacterium]